MSDGTRDRAPLVGTDVDSDDVLGRAFEMRHPAMALGWRAVRRNPLGGGLAVLLFLLLSGLVLEGGGLIEKRVNTWVEVNWAPGWAAHDRKVALARAQATADDMRVHLGHAFRLGSAITYFPVEGGYGEMLSKLMPTLDTVRQYYDTGVISRPAKNLPAGAKVRPIFIDTGAVAQSDGYVMLWYGKTYGFVPLPVYTGAGLPMFYWTQPPNIDPTASDARNDTYFAKKKPAVEPAQVAPANAPQTSHAESYVAAATMFGTGLLLLVAYRIAGVARPQRTEKLRHIFLQATADNPAPLGVGGRLWAHSDREWKKVRWKDERLTMLDAPPFDQRVSEEMLFARARQNGMRALLVVSILVAILLAAWGWGLATIAQAFDFIGLGETLASHGIGLLTVALTICVLVLALGIPLIVWEFRYRSGSQLVAGAMVLDPEPARTRIKDVEKQKALGGARLATESEMLAAASGAAMKGTSLDDLEFNYDE